MDGTTRVTDIRPDEAIELLDTEGLLAFNDRLLDEGKHGEIHHLADALIRQLQSCRDARLGAEEEKAEAIRSASAAVQREQEVQDRIHRGIAILQGTGV